MRLNSSHNRLFLCFACSIASLYSVSGSSKSPPQAKLGKKLNNIAIQSIDIVVYNITLNIVAPYFIFILFTSADQCVCLDLYCDTFYISFCLFKYRFFNLRVLSASFSSPKHAS
jgi:hypothetical protein